MRFETSDFQTSDFRRSDVKLAVCLETYPLLTARDIVLGDFSTPLPTLEMTVASPDSQTIKFQTSDFRRVLRAFGGRHYDVQAHSFLPTGMQAYINVAYLHLRIQMSHESIVPGWSGVPMNVFRF